MPCLLGLAQPGATLPSCTDWTTHTPIPPTKINPPPTTAEELELLPLAEKNKDLILQTLAPIAIEQAPALLPILVGTLKTSPSVFYGVAAAALAAEAGIVATSGNALIDVLAGIPLVGVAAVSAVAGSVLSSGIKIPASAPAKRRSAPAAAGASSRAAAIKVGGGGAAKPKGKVTVAAAKPAAAKASVKVRAWTDAGCGWWGLGLGLGYGGFGGGRRTPSGPDLINRKRPNKILLGRPRQGRRQAQDGPPRRQARRQVCGGQARGQGCREGAGGGGMHTHTAWRWGHNDGFFNPIFSFQAAPKAAPVAASKPAAPKAAAKVRAYSFIYVEERTRDA